VSVSGAGSKLPRDPLARPEVEAADSGRMLDDVLDQPSHVADAIARARDAGVPESDCAGGILVCGVGGSGVGGDLTAAAVGPRARRPIRTVRGYAPDPWVGPETLVLCSSYSGNTDATLACFAAAGAAGAPRASLTSGGRLAEASRSQSVPVIEVPSGFQPRAAVVYALAGTLECAARCGAAPTLAEELDSAVPLLRALAAEWGPDAGPDSEAKALAQRLYGKTAIIHGADSTAAAAYRWKTQLNENGKHVAFASELPEADHHELCIWERWAAELPLAAVFLVDPVGQNPGVRRRLDLTAESIARTGAPVHWVEARGETRVARILSMVLLADLVSVYVAALGGADPSRIPPIEELNRALAEGRSSLASGPVAS
jgi:glucose/mannose-6-phosphate isomerase